MSAGQVSAEDLTAVHDRIRWLHTCRLVAMAVLPLLGMAAVLPEATVQRIGLLAGGWAVLTVLGSTLVHLLSARHRRAVLTAMTVALLGDGVVLAAGWHLLGATRGNGGTVVLVYIVAVTLVATFRTGTKLALWSSLLALLVLDARAAGLLGPAEPFPVLSAVAYLGGLWAAVLATASLAAVNERELRRRRYDEKVLRELALAQGTAESPAAAATALARFARAELDARRSAVLLHLNGGTPGGIAAVVDAGGEEHVVTLHDPPPATLIADEVVLRHRLDEPGDEQVAAALPGAVNVVLVPFAAARLTGVLVVEGPRRVPRALSRRVERRMIATARLAAAQSAPAIGQAAAVAELALAAGTDGLTGLVNRGRFDALLAERVAGDRPFAVILVDLDHFKSVNDRFGHQAGDAVLRGVAAAVRERCGPGDVVARYGGEELVILTPGNVHDGAALAERVRVAVQAADVPVPVTATLGVAAWPAEERTAAGVIEAADRRLYAGKSAGRNRVVAAIPEWAG